MKLSVISLTKNSQENIQLAINSAQKLADEIVVIDDNSVDKTAQIVKKQGLKFVTHPLNRDFAQQRNFALEQTKGEWVLYLDDDERITEELAQEIRNVIKSPLCGAYAVPRKNIILGKAMVHGGWWPDYVERLFRREDFKKWQGDLHERPIFKGGLRHLKNPLLHLKHDNLSDMVIKTNKWSEIEGKLLFDARHPKMIWWRFIRIMITEGYNRLIKQKGILDGSEGIIYAIYQMWSRFISYAKLWEMQGRNVK